MHNLDVILNLVSKDQLVGIVFGFREDDGLAVTTITDQNVS